MRRTAYRPDPWQAPEWIVAGGGVACAVVMLLGTGYDAADLNPSLYPLTWPPLPLVPVLGILRRRPGRPGRAAAGAPPRPRRRAPRGRGRRPASAVAA